MVKVYFLAMFLAVMQTTPPVPRQASDNSAGASQPTQNQSAANNKPSVAPPVSNAKTTPENESGHNTVTTDDASKPVRVTELPTVLIKRHWTDNATWILTLCLVLVGAVQAVVLYYTIRAIKGQTSITTSAERAWILADTGDIPDDFTINPDKVSILDIKPIVKNHGRTPGRITGFAIKLIKLAAPGKLPAVPDYPPPSVADLLLPPNLYTQLMSVKISLDDFIKIRQGDPVLYIYGYINYDDLGGNQKQSRFCFCYHVPHGFDSTKRGFYTYGQAPTAYTHST